MRWVGLLAVMVPACFTIPDYDGPSGPATFDEDRDGVPDVDDLCPHIMGSAQVDTDTDGVGNACDPNPGMDDAVAFYNFQVRSLGDLSMSGRVEPNDNYTQIGVTGASTFNGVTAPQTWSTTEIEMRFAAFDATDSVGGGIGLRLGKYGTSDNQAGFCIFEVEANDRAKLTVLYRTPVGTEMETTGIIEMPYANISGRMHATLVGTELTCLVDQLNRPGDTDDFPPISKSLTLSIAAPPGQAGIFAIDAIMSAEYLFVAGLP